MDDRDALRFTEQIAELKSRQEELGRLIDGGYSERNQGGIVGKLRELERGQEANRITNEQVRRLILGEDGTNGLRVLVLRNQKEVAELRASIADLTTAISADRVLLRFLLVAMVAIAIINTGLIVALILSLAAI